MFLTQCKQGFVGRFEGLKVVKGWHCFAKRLEDPNSKGIVHAYIGSGKSEAWGEEREKCTLLPSLRQLCMIPKKKKKAGHKVTSLRMH